MKRMLCYGDSNTWGNSAFSRGRIPSEKQWVNILQKELGNDYMVLQEGMPGRVAGDLQIDEVWYNGRDVFRTLVISHSPLDIIIIWLGTNDFQIRYGRTAEQIAQDIMWYRDEVRNLIDGATMPKIMIIAPIRFHSTPDYFEANDNLYETVTSNLKQQPEVVLIDDVELTDDGVHFTYAGHEKVAHDIAHLLRRE